MILTKCRKFRIIYNLDGGVWAALLGDGGGGDEAGTQAVYETKRCD